MIDDVISCTDELGPDQENQHIFLADLIPDRNGDDIECSPEETTGGVLKCPHILSFASLMYHNFACQCMHVCTCLHARAYKHIHASNIYARTNVAVFVRRTVL